MTFKLNRKEILLRFVITANIVTVNKINVSQSEICGTHSASLFKHKMFLGQDRRVVTRVRLQE